MDKPTYLIHPDTGESVFIHGRVRMRRVARHPTSGEFIYVANDVERVPITRLLDATRITLPSEREPDDELVNTETQWIPTYWMLFSH